MTLRRLSLSLVTIIIVLSESLMRSIDASPYIVLEKGKKCMKVDLPAEATINVRWELLGQDENEMPDLQQIHTDMRKYAHERKKRQSNHKDMEDLVMPTILEIEPPDDIPEIEGARTILDKPQGVLRYNTKYEGRVSVCMSTMSRHPIIVALRISESAFISSPVDDVSRNNVEKTGEAQKMAKHHLNDMDRAIKQMIRESNLLLTNADAVKNEEAAFHQKSIDINAASRWWPIMHLIVLFVTGFTQANHVINFFKKRHII